MESIEKRPDGFWYKSDTNCAFGAVLFAQFKNKFMVIRKAHRNNYEYSGMLALPGGMVRHKNRENFSFKEASQISLQSRFVQETNVPLSSLAEIYPISSTTPVVTSYFAKGKLSDVSAHGTDLGLG